MTEEFALATDDAVTEIQQTTSNDIAEIMSKGFKPSNVEKVKNQLGLSIVKVIKKAYGLAESELRQGFSLYGSGSRGYAMGGDFILSVSDFYSQYVPLLSGNLAVRSYGNMLSIIKSGEQKGLSEREIKDEIAESYAGVRGRGGNIVRTEGTRASSLARRAVGKNGRENGNGPDYYIYKALRDGSTTRTCKESHNFYWNANADSFAYWPPKHFYCRAGVVYAWEKGFNPKEDNLRLLTPQARSRLLGIQRKEFPQWIQQQDNDIWNPRGQIRNSARSRIVNDANIEYARRNLNDAGLILPSDTSYDDTMRRMIQEISDSSNKIDTELRRSLERELLREIAGNERLPRMDSLPEPRGKKRR